MLAIVAVYWIYRCFQKRNEYFKELGSPCVPPAGLLDSPMSPILRRRRQKHAIDNIIDLYNYNPEAKYLGVFDNVLPVIMIRDPEIIKNVAIKSFDNFPDHRVFVDDSVDSLFGGNLFQLTGDKWKETRNFVTPVFTSSKMKAMFELMVKCADNFTNHMAEQAKNPKNVLATKDLFTKYTNDIVASCAFGLDIDTLKNPQNEFYLLGREASNFEGITIGLKFMLARTFPRLSKLLRLKIVPDHIVAYFKNVIKTNIDTRDKMGITRPDMIQLLMAARGKTTEHVEVDITWMTPQAFIFFFGGFETTSTQMCIISYLLIIHPEVQKRLQEEIDQVIKATYGKPTYESIINGMPYLDAVFNESMRLYPQVSALDRICAKAFELPSALPGCKPLTVRPGTNIWIPGAGIHRDKQFYDNPNVLDPERYLNKKVTINRVENLGFGIEPRSCIGSRFAIMETKILFFFLLAKFNMKPSEKTCKNFDYDKSAFGIKPEGGYWMTVEATN